MVGNLVYSLVLGMSVPDVSGLAIANLEIETLQHKKPTFHGDTIYAETKVLDEEGVVEQARPRDRHGRDLGASTSAGEEVCYFRRKVMVPTRERREAARKRPYTPPE